MNILIDIGHPAHVHLFKNFIHYLKSHEHSIFITSRDKDVTNRLLEHLGFDYIPLSLPGSGFAGHAFELFKRDIGIFRLHRQHHFDLAFGSSVSIAHLSFLFSVKSYNFAEDDDAIVPFYTYLTYPFTTKIINPKGLKYKKWKEKRIQYPSYQKLAYLHPNNFTPDRSIPRKYGLEPYQYVVLRKSALNAHHDLNAKGLRNELWDQVQQKVSGLPQVYSFEDSKSHRIDPWDMHDILAFAKLLISDSQSMTVEAAVLGVPSIRYNSFVGKISCLNDLENTYNLTYGFCPGQEEACLSKIDWLLESNNLNKIWQEKRTLLLKDKIDFNEWMIELFEKVKHC